MQSTIGEYTLTLTSDFFEPKEFGITENKKYNRIETYIGNTILTIEKAYNHGKK